MGTEGCCPNRQLCLSPARCAQVCTPSTPGKAPEPLGREGEQGREQGDRTIPGHRRVPLRASIPARGGRGGQRGPETSLSRARGLCFPQMCCL